MSEPEPGRPRDGLLHEVCRYLPPEEAQLIRAMDPDDDQVHVAAFTAVKRHEVVLPEDLYDEMTDALTSLLRNDDTVALTRIEVRVRGDVVVVELIGELDIHVIEDLRSTFLHVITPESNKVVIDLAPATFLDSIILGSLVAAQRRATEVGGWLRLAGPRPNVRHVLSLTQLDKVFDVHDDVDQACATEDQASVQVRTTRTT